MSTARPRPIWLLQALFGWLHLALTAPSVYLWLGLPLVMRQHGWSARPSACSSWPACLR
jgi:hypothetical protein